MTPGAPPLQVGVATHVGRVRQHNEDSVRTAQSVFVVADGMGGHAAGEVASALAVEAMVELDGRDDLHPRDLIAQVAEANRRILDAAASNPEHAGMGTTVSGLAMVHASGEARWVVFNLGDSRVYRLSRTQFTQVTIDHSEVQELVDHGVITPEQARMHPSRNVVTRSLGRIPCGVVDTWVLPASPGERFVVCSDGLSNEVPGEQIGEVVAESDTVQQAAEELVRLAVEAGGRDNITVVVVETPADVVGGRPESGSVVAAGSELSPAAP